MQEADPLLRTKLHLPFTRQGLVSRPRLEARIAQGLAGPLTLVTAPAGFGKTTLAASSVAACGIPLAWLSLDKNDNQSGRFLRYLVAALQQADRRIGAEAARLLDAAWQAPDEMVLTSLINDLDAGGSDIALVLDDYQFISSQAVHEDVTFLVEHCPGRLHLVIASRSDPPLPLALLRARGQIVELRAGDLRFTESEAVQFFGQFMELHLDSESVAALEERTEGWIAGLQMASIALQSHLSMHDQQDAHAFIEEFSGTNRYILDYLLEEVLAGQAPGIQRFLLRTSILERLTAPLCDAVLPLPPGEGLPGENDNPQASSDPVSPGSSASVLEYLERANLFLVPLDDKRLWYRYHHLFADLLQARLQQTSSPQDIATLHTRAGQWYERNGLPYEAIYHASLTGNNEWVEHLIEHNYVEVFRRGETASIRFLTGKLSRELVHSRPWLCIYEAESHAWFGELDEADALLAIAEEHIQSAATSSETRPMLGHLDYIKSRVTAMRGDLGRAVELSLEARENTPARNPALLGAISAIFGYVRFLDGDFATAIRALNETIESGTSAGVINTTIAAYCVLARIYALQGQLHKSFETYQEGARFVHNVGGRHLGATGLVDVGLADVLYEWNDLEGALGQVNQGIQLIPNWNKSDDIALAYTTLARILHAQGKAAAALEAITKGSQVIRTRGVFSEARDAVHCAEIRLLLAQQDGPAFSRGTRWLEERPGARGTFRFADELAHMTLARAYLAQKRADEAARSLSGLEASAESGGRQGRLVEILILKALALLESGDPAQALATLARSLALAEPEGYIRVFVDEGQRMQTLLARWLAHAGGDRGRDYAVHLLSQFAARRDAPAASQEKGAPAASLVEPLSQRELEVLHLMALGKTNQEIAGQLIVAPGTIKAHAASIYRKLDANNRTEAVANARRLGVLP